jgi:hypothetical protein
MMPSFTSRMIACIAERGNAASSSALEISVV